MDFVDYFLYGLLKATHWPRKIGVPCFRKHVVVVEALHLEIQSMVETAVALGVTKPATAAALIGHLFSDRDWGRQPAQELWCYLDPTEKISSNPEVSPIQTIVAWPFDTGLDEALKYFGWPNLIKRASRLGTDHPDYNYVEWKYVDTPNFYTFYHIRFAQGLVWGLGYPKEAAAAYELQRQNKLKELPGFIKAGLDAEPQQACPTLNEISFRGEQMVELFEAVVRPFAPTPHELQILPQIVSRFT